MIIEEIIDGISHKIPKELSSSLLEAYSSALKEYKKGNWKYAGNELGQFVETARRILEYVITGEYTALSQSLPLFNEVVLKFYEQTNVDIDVSFRILIPRYLFSMYTIRNKRGIIHKGVIEPNAMDSTILLYCAKWILAEIVRLCSCLSFEKTAEIINYIVEKEMTMFWQAGNSIRLLNNAIDTSQKVLCLLYYKDKQSDKELQSQIEYSNTTRFKSILKELHKARKIEYANGICEISPLGLQVAELIVANYSMKK